MRRRTSSAFGVPGEDKHNPDARLEQIARRMTAVSVTEKDMRQCEAVCPTHGIQCRLKMFEQKAYPMHGHFIDGKMCVWK